MSAVRQETSGSSQVCPLRSPSALISTPTATTLRFSTWVSRSRTMAPAASSATSPSTRRPGNCSITAPATPPRAATPAHAPSLDPGIASASFPALQTGRFWSINPTSSPVSALPSLNRPFCFEHPPVRRHKRHRDAACTVFRIGPYPGFYRTAQRPSMKVSLPSANNTRSRSGQP